MNCIDGRKIADAVLRDVQKNTLLLKKKGVTPGLGILIVGEDKASHTYVAIKLRTAATLGIYAKRLLLPSSASLQEIIHALKKLQRNPHIHGVIVQAPLPRSVDLDQVTPHILLRKDIDCFHPENLSRFFTGKDVCFSPPTAEAVTRCIESTGATLHEKRILVVGRGFFGRQIATHCINNGGIVTLVGSQYKDLSKLGGISDIIISVVGRHGVIQGSMVKSGTIIIDVGISKNEQGHIVGDVDMESLKKKDAYVTPVPGGVGPITVALLMENVVRAATLTLKKD